MLGNIFWNSAIFVYLFRIYTVLYVRKYFLNFCNTRVFIYNLHCLKCQEFFLKFSKTRVFIYNLHNLKCREIFLEIQQYSCIYLESPLFEMSGNIFWNSAILMYLFRISTVWNVRIFFWNSAILVYLFTISTVWNVREYFFKFSNTRVFTYNLHCLKCQEIFFWNSAILVYLFRISTVWNVRKYYFEIQQYSCIYLESPLFERSENYVLKFSNTRVFI